MCLKVGFKTPNFIQKLIWNLLGVKAYKLFYFRNEELRSIVQLTLWAENSKWVKDSPDNNVQIGFYAYQKFNPKAFKYWNFDVVYLVRMKKVKSYDDECFVSEKIKLIKQVATEDEIRKI
ncbi:MAG: hypothetical protein ACFFDT_31425 [Candidatus Hodarchaeota archaeon]